MTSRARPFGGRPASSRALLDALVWPLAGVVALVATVTSLSLSGIGPLGWDGRGFFPCELCWYQRILMYPLAVLIAVGLVRRDDSMAVPVLILAALGVLVASYHVLIQINPDLEAGQCLIGGCSGVQHRFFGRFTIPQASLTAFALITAAAAFAWRRGRRATA